MAGRDDKPGDGILFVNDRKEHEKQPDYNGRASCPHCEREVRLAGWKRKAKNTGVAFLSMKLTIPQERDERGYRGPRGRDEEPPF